MDNYHQNGDPDWWMEMFSGSQQLGTLQFQSKPGLETEDVVEFDMRVLEAGGGGIQRWYPG